MKVPWAKKGINNHNQSRVWYDMGMNMNIMNSGIMRSSGINNIK